MAKVVDRVSIKLRWEVGGKAPCNSVGSCDAVVGNTTMYCKYDNGKKIYAYNIPSSNWSPVPNCPIEGFTISFVDGLLTIIGGYGHNDKITNKLLSLTGEGRGRRWTDKFPPMPTTL